MKESNHIEEIEKALQEEREEIADWLNGVAQIYGELGCEDFETLIETLSFCIKNKQYIFKKEEE